MLVLLTLLFACATGPTKEAGTKDTAGSPDTATGGHYHPAGYASSSVHGIAAKYQEEDCLSCHGEDLTGGTSGVSCDSCHADGWRTDCTFCHGGTDNATGAPPRDIDDLDTDLAFPAHTAHVSATIHSAWDCDQCHVKPEDVLSSGHFLVGDPTPGVAEVDLSAGLSSAGSYSAGTCSNLYCHGNARGDYGSVAVDANVACGDCHPGPDSGSAAWGAMSGEHQRHLGEGIACSECHSATVSEAGEITGLAEHVNGTVTYALPSGISETSGTCNGVCHSEIHLLRTWD